MAQQPTSTTTISRNSSTGSSLPLCTTTTTTTTAEVKAPSSLPAGYVFWASYQGRMFQVKVPKNGVEAGQIITTVIVEKTNDTTTIEQQQQQRPIISSSNLPPRGVWKDGLFDCFRYGLFHPSIVNAWCCPQVLMSQILTRMKLVWLFDCNNNHHPSNNNNNNNNNNNTSSSTTSSSTSRKLNKNATIQRFVFFLTILFAYDVLLSPSILDVQVDDEGIITVATPSNPTERWKLLLYFLATLPLTFYMFKVSISLRAAVREKYGIPTGRLGIMEDCCLVMCCNCCSMAQLARQTANYEEEEAAFCSKNGLLSSSSSRNNNNNNIDMCLLIL